MSKNGTKYLIFDNMSYTPPAKQVVVKPEMKTKYEFKDDGNNKKVVAEANKETPLGQFIPGNYAIDATKTTQYGVFSGKLKFDFKYSTGEKINVTEDFNEAKLNIKLKGASDLNDNSLKVKINDDEMDYSNSKEYGPYPDNKDIKLTASGKVKGKTFNAETKTIKASKLKDNNSITLSFDSDKISDYVEKKEKEENNLINKLSQFFSGYAATLNQAISLNNINLVQNYFDKSSESYKQLQENFSSNSINTLSSPTILSANQTGNKIKGKIQYLTSNGTYETENYEVKENSSDHDNETYQLINLK